MAGPVTSPILSLIRRATDDPRLEDRPDAELLRRLVDGRDAAAFGAIVRRHGPVVLDVCRGLLRNEPDAEDAFQATFLVLARKAASIRKGESLASWLHGVAYRAARRARTEFARRREHQCLPPDRAAPPGVDDLSWREVRGILHEELTRLPERLRGPLVLCYLEGMTHDRAAAELGLPRGTLKGRLERGRALLHVRLVRRGLGPTAVLAASVWPGAATAAVPPALAASAIRVATSPAAGTAVGGTSGTVAVLTDGVLKAMFLKKIKTAAAVLVLTLGVAAVTSGMLAKGQTGGTGRPVDERPTAGQKDVPPAAEKPVEPPAGQKQAKEAFTAWGGEVGGLQAGLGFRPGGKRAYSHGETVAVVLRVRNVGKEAVEFKHVWAFFVENPPTITDPGGKAVRLPRVAAEGRHLPRSPEVAPGKEVDLYEWKFEFRPTGDGGDKERPTITVHGTGTFGLQYQRVVGPTSSNPTHPNPALDKLATGKLELEIKSAVAERPVAGLARELDAKKKAEALAGTWAYVSTEGLGPKGRGPKTTFEGTRDTLTFDGAKCVLETRGDDGKVTRTEFAVTLDAAADPPRVTVQTTHPDKAKIRYVYEVKGDTLRLCFYGLGEADGAEVVAWPDGFDLDKLEAGKHPTLLVLKRVDAKEEKPAPKDMKE